MLSLRESLQKVNPNKSINGIREFAAIMANSGESGIFLRKFLEAMSVYNQIFISPLTVLWQNTALFPMGILTPTGDRLIDNVVNEAFGTKLYNGSEREKAIPTIVQRLRNEQPDIVGFCEVWVDSEARLIMQQLADIYPYALYGPQEDAPRVLEFEYFDGGGLLLLSRHPITASHQTIYRQCCGEDCLSNKGVIHARILVPGHPTHYDVFITHLQSCPPEVPTIPGIGEGSCVERLENSQLKHLNSFIYAHSSSGGIPILMGDLNIDGQNFEKSKLLDDRLQNFVDIHPLVRITRDSHGTFQSDRPGKPSNDNARNKEGKCLDYIMFGRYTGNRFFPFFEKAEVVNDWHTSPGKDLSDHYGLRANIVAIWEKSVSAQTIQSVQVTMKSFHCLRETGGPVSSFSEVAGDDEMLFRLGGITENGQKQKVGFNGDDDDDFDSIDTGEAMSFPSNVLTFSDPGSWFAIEFQAWEDDVVSKISLGPEKIYINRINLLYCKQKGLPVQIASPVLRGDGGEYVVFVDLTVT